MVFPKMKMTRSMVLIRYMYHQAELVFIKRKDVALQASQFIYSKFQNNTDRAQNVVRELFQILIFRSGIQII